MNKQLLFFILILGPTFADAPLPIRHNKVLHSIHSSSISMVVSELEKQYQQNKCYDLQTLEALGHDLVLKYQRKTTLEYQMLTLHALSLFPQFTPPLELVENVVQQTKEYALQQQILQLMAQWQKEEYDPFFIFIAQQSPFLNLRMQSLGYLSNKKAPATSGLLEGLIQKLPREVYPALTFLIVSMDLPYSRCLVKKFIESGESELRCLTLLSIGYAQKEQFLHYIRSYLTHSNYAELEAAITAVGLLKDMESYDTLKSLAKNTNSSVALASWVALVHLGDTNFLDEIKQAAAQEDLAAISALGTLEKGKEVLEQCVLSPSKEVSYNAAIALAKMGNPTCLKKIYEIFYSHTPLHLLPVFSHGKSFLYWKFYRKIPAANAETQLKIQKDLKQALLQKLVKLPLPYFLESSQKILEEPLEELVPTVIQALSQMDSPECDKLLQKYVTYKTPSQVRIPALLSLQKNQQDAGHKKYLFKWADDFIKNPKTQKSLQKPDFSTAPFEELLLFYSVVEHLSQQNSDECISHILQWVQETPESFHPVLGAFLLLAIE